MFLKTRQIVPILTALAMTGWSVQSHADSIDQPCTGVVFVKQDDGSWVVLHDGAKLVDKGEGNYQIWDVGAKTEHNADTTRSDLLNLYCRDTLI